MRVTSLKYVALCALLLGACDEGIIHDHDDDGDDTGSGGDGSGGETSFAYQASEIVTNANDPDLVNPWGLVGGEGVFWIANNGTGKVSTYDGSGRQSDEYPTGRFDLGEGITGVAHNEDATAFILTCGTVHEGAEFLFASESGKIIGINDESPVEGMTVVDRSSVGAVYLGVALLDSATGPLMLAADFANARIDVFDANARLVNSTMFADPEMPAGYGPFNVRTIGDRVYVTYAKESDELGEEEAGAGLGAVTVFDPSGNIVGRITGGSLNAPWGVTAIGRDLYVGNFGDGYITRFDSTSFASQGLLLDRTDQPITLEGLWGLEAGSDDAGTSGVLYFVSGPADETGGVFGRIEQVVK